MKLVKAETFVVKIKPYIMGGPYHYYLKLTTDDGIVGWGETAVLSALHDYYNAYDSIVQGLFEKELKGKNPMNRESLYQTLYMHLCSARPEYIGSGILSAFDIALWDIAGKYLNTPIYNLLGGKMRDKLRAYSYIYDDYDRYMDFSKPRIHPDPAAIWLDPDRAAAAAQKMVEEDGFTALKIDPLPMSKHSNVNMVDEDGTFDSYTPWNITREELHNADRVLGAVRKAVGPNVDILCGTHGQTCPATAREFAPILEKHEVRWFEEPTPCENRKMMGAVAASTNVPIASGERLTGIYEYQQLFENNCVAFAQPDLGACGGISAGKKIATLAEANYVQMSPHVWGGALILAAAIQLDMSIPNFFIQEGPYKCGGIHALVLDEPICYKDGYIIPSDRPGLGHNLVESKLEEFRA